VRLRYGFLADSQGQGLVRLMQGKQFILLRDRLLLNRRWRDEHWIWLLSRPLSGVTTEVHRREAPCSRALTRSGVIIAAGIRQPFLPGGWPHALSHMPAFVAMVTTAVHFAMSKSSGPGAGGQISLRALVT
jgi:hypothetical protein